MKSDKDLAFYSGLPNGDIFKSRIQYFNSGKESENINYCRKYESEKLNDEDAPE